MATIPKKRVLDDHKVSIRSDSADQSRLRLLQALWREREGLPIGLHERPDVEAVELGSRVDDDEERRQGHNFLTPAIAEQVRRALDGDECAGVSQAGRLISERRLWSDLLSSQPLAFNLFGELAADLDLATAVARKLWGDHIDAVTSVCFEWSPGRGDVTYLDNSSAFDVFVAYSTTDGGRGFVGIEVKYHENMRARAGKGTDWYDGNPRYREVAEVSGAFAPDELARVGDESTRGAGASLGGTPMQQIWFDHLLALSMLQADDGWTEGHFLLLHPAINGRARRAAETYALTLVDPSTAAAMTLESFVQAVREISNAPWIDRFDRRYLDMGPVDALLGPGED